MLAILFSLVLSLSAFAREEFPTSPDAQITPGALCERPASYRYRERIPYCNRDVSPELKQEVFKDYRRLGYTLSPKTRDQYKIDHLIPLCMGGGNRKANLWPQHQSIYIHTDMLEFVGCEKLKNGRIKQMELINLVLNAKRNLNLIPQTLKYLENLR